MQQQVLLASVLADPDEPSRSVITALEVPLGTDDTGVQHALDALVARHPILSCVFVPGKGGTVARVLPGRPVELRRAKMSGDLDAAVYEVVAALQSNPLPIDSEPPLRAVLLRAPSRAILLLQLHHILCDGMSVRLLAADLGAYWRGDLLGPAPRSYLEYAIGQRESSASVVEACWYWRDMLGDTAYCPPTGAADPSALGPEPLYVLRRPIPAELVCAVESHCALSASTPFIVYAGAVGAAVGAYHGSHEVRIGALVANRDNDQYEQTVGPFANTVVLRLPAALDGLLTRASEVVLGAMAHQGVPLEIVLALILDDDSLCPGAPVRPFDVTFEYEPGLTDMARGAVLLTGDAAGRARFDDLGKRSAPLTIAVRTTKGGLQLVVECDSSIYSPDVTAVMATSVLDLTARLVDTPGRSPASSHQQGGRRSEHRQ